MIDVNNSLLFIYATGGALAIFLYLLALPSLMKSN